jgi:hypothetical protein
MSHSRFVLLPLVACSTLLLAGGIGPGRPAAAPRPAQAASAAPLAPLSQPAPPPAARADAGAEAALDRALALLGPDRLRWLQVTLWQRITAGGLSCEAEGRYLAAPGRRFRLDLKTHHGGCPGALQVICDGTTLYQATKIGSGTWDNYKRYRIEEVQAALDDPSTAPAVRDEFLRDQNCAGVLTVLPALRERMTWFRQERVRRDGRLLVKLSATWRPAEAEALVPPGTPWPDDLPRQVRLYLEPETSWPHRLEWWGPDPDRPDDSLLIQMEFRDPVLNQPLSEERCAREFRPDADPGRFPEVTGSMTARIRARSGQWYTQHVVAKPAQ